MEGQDEDLVAFPEAFIGDGLRPLLQFFEGQMIGDLHSVAPGSDDQMILAKPGVRTPVDAEKIWEA